MPSTVGSQPSAATSRPTTTTHSLILMVGIKVLYFAGLKDQVKVREEEIELEIATTDELRKILMKKYPNASLALEKTQLAVNLQYIDGSMELHQGDQVAFIPHISGG